MTGSGGLARVSDAHRLDGTLMPADQGCGMRSLLVVAGPEAGTVWTDHGHGCEAT